VNPDTVNSLLDVIEQNGFAREAGVERITFAIGLANDLS